MFLLPSGCGGNVFSGLGNRLSTELHTGTFRLSFRLDSPLGRNLVASFTLTISMSVLLGILTKTIAVVVGVDNTISLFRLVAISTIGGLLGSIPVATASVLLTFGAVRKGWDLDNLVAPHRLDPRGHRHHPGAVAGSRGAARRRGPAPVQEWPCRSWP